jgi:hypothetical protein
MYNLLKSYLKSVEFREYFRLYPLAKREFKEPSHLSGNWHSLNSAGISRRHSCVQNCTLLKIGVKNRD